MEKFGTQNTFKEH